MHDKYTNELAGTVFKLFQDGTSDPSAEEIAEAHFPERALGGEIVEGIRKRLFKIRNVIEHVYETQVSLVSEKYYVLYRFTPPETMKAAYSCLAGGYHKQAWGLRRHDGDADLIWQAQTERNMVSAAGKEKASTDRVLTAIESDDLSDESAIRLLTKMRESALPDRPELAARLFTEIERKQLELTAPEEE